MNDLIDLHIHSDRSSDGEFSPCRIVRLAREKGLKAISIADHDTVDAYPEALHCGEEEGVEVIPSIEVTTLFDDREFHLLLPFIDWECEAAAKLVEKVAKRRISEAQERIGRLQRLGLEISMEEVIEAAGSHPPLGVTIAQVFLNKPEAKNDPAFKKYYEEESRDFAPYLFYGNFFMEGKPAFVPRRNIAIFEVLDKVHQTGGVPVLAHPGAYFQQVKRDDLIRLKERGLEGIEVYTSYHNSRQTEQYRKMSEDLQLVPTAGSDFHGSIKPQIPFGFLTDGGYWMVEELRKKRRL